MSCSKPTAIPTESPLAITPTTELTPVPPTPTQVPMAILVNGEGIPLADYEADLTRLQMALQETGKSMTPEEQKQTVLDNYTDELLLAQAASQAGYAVSDADLQARIDKIIAEIGGAEKLGEWQSTYGYSDDSFRVYLKRSLLAAWQRDKIADAVPTTADQVHARQLIYQSEVEATAAYTDLQAGTPFSDLSKEQDPVLSGDLGWFPRGTLTQPVVEEAVFALQPGQYTAVIKSDIGFHIVFLVERDAEHPLSVEARRMLQEKALADWLTQQKAASTIQILVP
ncbi:MAG TPA: SurA N-terminal domain-containing protein [Anaerolineaceae bacterium]|nr:SurA N-terminal domain-containing protein [Anaerolineaceae bacterium]